MDGRSSKGAQIYTPLSLKIYDWWVLNISNSYAWRCKTEPVLLNHFQRHLGVKHMDIGVGTGYYLAKTLEEGRAITLLDLNNNSLIASKKRIGQQRIDACVQHDIFQPLPAKLHNSFDSISLFYLLHCLPGNMIAKSKAIENVAAAINDQGVVYGATILGQGVSHNAFGRKLMALYNKKGIFSNEQDSLEDLQVILGKHFKSLDIQLHGTVAVFSAKHKR